MVKLNWTTMQGFNRRGVLVLLACAIFGVVPRAEASPFLLNLVSSDSSDGGYAGGGGDHGARLGLRVRTPEMPGPVFIYNGAALPGLAKSTVSTPALSTSALATISLIEAPKSSYRAGVGSVAEVGSVVSAGRGSVTQLDLGDGTNLSVSDTVRAALADALSPASGDAAASSPATPSVANDVKNPNAADVSGNNSTGSNGPSSGYNSVSPLPDRTASPLPDSTASGVADETVKAILADLSSGIVSPVGEETQRAAGDLAPVENLVQNPEPATLVLLASALALTAGRLRRQRH